METLTFNSFGRQVTVTADLTTYTNGRTAVVFFEEDGQFGVLTTNMPDVHLNEGEILVKDWSENEPLFQAALAAGWIKQTGREVHSGYVFPKVCTLEGHLAELAREL